MITRNVFLTICLIGFLFFCGQALAQNDTVVEEVQAGSNHVWTLLAAFMVFLMLIGFLMLEIGFGRAKNAVNIAIKSLISLSLVCLTFWVLGFGVMFGSSPTGLFGTTGFFFSDFDLDKNPWLFTFWAFEVLVAAFFVAIISGAISERTKLIAYLLITPIASGIIYPVFGSWAWGSSYKGAGWLENLGFIDFAGSTVVCSTAGWVALAGAIVVGPRIGKFGKSSSLPNPLPGHNLPLSAVGVLFLWLGWCGFNAGNTFSASLNISVIVVITTLAASAGAVLAMITVWVKCGKPDAAMILSGTLAGLVSISAGCNNLTPFFAVLTGAIAGVLFIYSAIFFERIGIDDPLGAISIFGVAGAWGTLSAGIFNTTAMFSLKIIAVQLIGILAGLAWSFVSSFLMFKLIDHFVGLRSDPDDEQQGLDYSEHGTTAYPNFSVRNV